MPNYKKHLFAGLVSYIILLCSFIYFKIKIINPFQLLLSSLFGSLFPDIDTKSKIQKTFYTFFFIVFIFLVINNESKLLITLSFISLIPLVVDHRGIFHKTWFIFFIGLLIFFIGYKYYPNHKSLITVNTLFFVTGALSHLFLDLGLRRMLRI